MGWGESQSSQKPEVAHGVSSLSLFVFLGAATDLIRRRASPTSATTFFPPATTPVFFRPKCHPLLLERQLSPDPDRHRPLALREHPRPERLRMGMELRVEAVPPKRLDAFFRPALQLP